MSKKSLRLLITTDPTALFCVRNEKGEEPEGEEFQDAINSFSDVGFGSIYRDGCTLDLEGALPEGLDESDAVDRAIGIIVSRLIDCGYTVTVCDDNPYNSEET